jgi:hypothetical protein
MSTRQLEKQLASLQERVATLEAAVKPAKKASAAWQELFGSAKNDDLHREAARLGAKWRVRANREGR